MIKSMTGFGQAQGLIQGRQVTIEIRGVNNRFREVSVKLPRPYQALEEPLKKMAAAGVARGRVDLWLQVDEGGLKRLPLKADLELAGTYLELLESLRAKCGFKEPVTLSQLLECREIISVADAPLDMEGFGEALKGIVEEALASFTAMRAREGEALAGDLGERLGAVAAGLKQITARREGFLAAYLARLKERLKELTEGFDLDHNRLYQEAALMADRADVTEELVRLDSHLSQFARLLESQAPVGRKLDFLLQEMVREVNTIGSKAQELEITKLVVDLKAELEKMREQAQNIE